MTYATVAGTATSAFRPSRASLSDLAVTVVEGALADADLPLDAVDEVHLGSVSAFAWGQPNLRGPAILEPLVSDLRPGTPVWSVEGACATGLLAFASAVRAVRSGQARVAVAVGVERCINGTDPAWYDAILASGTVDAQGARRVLEADAARLGVPWEPAEDRPLVLDLLAARAHPWLTRDPDTRREVLLSLAARRLHQPVAELRRQPPLLAGLPAPLFADLSDGAAAVVITADGPVRVRGLAVGGGQHRPLDAPSSLRSVAERLWADANVTPAQVDAAEVHDASAFCTLLHLDTLGLVPLDDAVAFVHDGEPGLTLNASGGLLRNGHPIAASGLAMVASLADLIRDGSSEIGVAWNAGGLLGWDEALVAATVLDRA